MSPAEISALLPAGVVGQIRSLERIKHGLTNDSWRVITDRADLVLRRGNASEASLQIDRESEARVLELVAVADLGPQVLLNDHRNRVLITRYAGPTWTPDQALDCFNIDRLATTFARLHGLAVPDGVHRLDLHQVVRGYVTTLAEHDAGATLRTAALEARATHIVEALGRMARECLCHNDVHALNIVDDGTLRLIDWEYAGIGDPFFDLASVCVYHTYDRHRRQRLLSSYLQSNDDDPYRRLELACWLFEYVRDLWMAVRELKSI
jgi:thiamine kinase